MLAAVSGGSDSSALLLLLCEHLRASGAHARLLAVTVDHGLRPGSDAEARAVSALAAKLGIAHRILRWEGPKPATGLPAAARAARYRLLVQAAAEAGARIVFTGHTADDQAETVAMRRSRGPGRGLAGMAPLTLFDGHLWIARPLLGVRRGALRDLLRDRGLAWLDDPTNADPRFERARWRVALAVPGAVEEFLAAARSAGAARERTAGEAACLIGAAADRPARGLFRIRPAFLAGAPRPAIVEALRFLLATVGGRSFPVEGLRAGALLDALAAPGRHTLGGAVIERRADAVYLFRESRGIGAVEAGEVYDGRFRTSQAGPPGLLGPWNGEGGDDGLPSSATLPPALLRAAFRAAPAFRADGNGCPVEPSSVGIRLTPLVAPFREFLPDFDFALAQALARLVGAPAFPRPPCRAGLGDAS